MGVETNHLNVGCVSHVNSFSAEIQEFQQRSCLAPYHFYSKFHKEVGTPAKFCTGCQMLKQYSLIFVKLLSKYGFKN